jgi:hypothetical protein
MQMRLRNFLFAVAACAPLLAGLHAEPRHASTPAASQPPKQPEATAPFPSARGVATFELAIGGLGNANARVAAGARIFGICWLGGQGPYSVILRDAKGAALVDEEGIDSRELVKASKPTSLEPGDYTVAINDGTGKRVSGQFTVLAAKAMPIAPMESGAAPLDGNSKAIGTARWLMTQGPTYQYEAYLTLVPLTITSGNSEAGQLLDQICQRNH